MPNTDLEYQLLLTQNELDKQNHFIELLRDQVAELKLGIEKRDTELRVTKGLNFRQTKEITDLRKGNDYLVNENKELKEVRRNLLNTIEQIEKTDKSCSEETYQLVKNAGKRLEQELKNAKETITWQGQAIQEQHKGITELHQINDSLRNRIKWDNIQLEGQKGNIEALEDKEKASQSIIRLLLKFIEYLQWQHKSNNSYNGSELEHIANIKILKKKLKLATAILSKFYFGRLFQQTVSPTGFLVEHSEINSPFFSKKDKAIVKRWLKFDKDSANQVDTILDSLPTVPSLTELQRKLELAQEKNHALQNQINNFLSFGQGGSNFKESQLLDELSKMESDRDKLKEEKLKCIEDKNKLTHHYAQLTGKVNHLTEIIDKNNTEHKRVLAKLEKLEKEEKSLVTKLNEDLYSKNNTLKELSKELLNLKTLKEKGELIAREEIESKCKAEYHQSFMQASRNIKSNMEQVLRKNQELEKKVHIAHKVFTLLGLFDPNSKLFSNTEVFSLIYEYIQLSESQCNKEQV